MKPDFRPNRLRRHVLDMAFFGQSVHVPCAFSLVEIVSALYAEHLKYDPKDPAASTRDRLVLSKGHGVMALYAAFRELGWIEQRDIERYFHDDSRLFGLSEADVPGLEVTSGSLGHGLPIATGMALGFKQQNQSQRVYCIVGDGELNEGTMWESILIAAHHKLSNLTIIVDANGFQAMGRIEDILGLEPLADKFKSFGFDAFECDGHDLARLNQGFELLKKSTRPQVIIARTIKGRGVSFMENDNVWHYTRLTKESHAQALAELGT